MIWRVLVQSKKDLIRRPRKCNETRRSLLDLLCDALLASRRDGGSLVLHRNARLGCCVRHGDGNLLIWMFVILDGGTNEYVITGDVVPQEGGVLQDAGELETGPGWLFVQ